MAFSPSFLSNWVWRFRIISEIDGVIFEGLVFGETALHIYEYELLIYELIKVKFIYKIFNKFLNKFFNKFLSVKKLFELIFL
jgi:hypothetical protein